MLAEIKLDADDFGGAQVDELVSAIGISELALGGYMLQSYCIHEARVRNIPCKYCARDIVQSVSVTASRMQHMLEFRTPCTTSPVTEQLKKQSGVFDWAELFRYSACGFSVF